VEGGGDRPQSRAEDEQGMGLFSLDAEPITCLACGGDLRIIVGEGVRHTESAVDADHEAVPPRGRDGDAAE
jgi:hypothetical protein